MSMLDTVVIQIAKTAHEVNRAWSAINGDLSHKSWKETPKNIQDSTIDGVVTMISGDIKTPEESWQNWKAYKLNDGWTHGPVKDLEAKQHPNLVDNYEDLPAVERHKDLMFMSVVLSFLES